MNRIEKILKCDVEQRTRGNNFVNSHYSTRKDSAAMEASHRLDETLIDGARL
jgi:hypothetical protein